MVLRNRQQQNAYVDNAALKRDEHRRQLYADLRQIWRTGNGTYWRRNQHTDCQTCTSGDNPHNIFP